MTSLEQKIAEAKTGLENALDILEGVALDLVRERCLEMSRRFPTRLVSYETGNGARSLTVARKRIAKVAEYDMVRYFDLQWCWPTYVAGSSLFDELDKLEYDTNQNWLGTDCLYFLGGVQQ